MAVVAVALLMLPASPSAQTRPAASAGAPNNTVALRGFATFGSITFQATNSFEAVLGAASGPIFGGGAQVLLPWGLYVEVSASQFKQDGERVFVGPANEVFALGIPVSITITPLEVTGGFRFRKRSRAGTASRVGAASRVVAYGGLGFSSYGYREASEFADASENVVDRFSGFHVVGGAEYAVLRWMSVGGEVAWSSIADALGAGGVSASFQERNLGGSTIRVKLSVGR